LSKVSRPCCKISAFSCRRVLSQKSRTLPRLWSRQSCRHFLSRVNKWT
ncbi:flagellar P-ring family protein, partial [Vibrio parahaemolyticus VPTS-2010]